MQITIGQTSDDRRKIQKTFSGTTISVQLKQPCDILHPVFIMSWDSDYIHANYLHAPDLGRYYYIDNVILLTGSRAELHCSVDVLMSYASEILNLDVYVTRNQAERNKLIVDEKYPAEIMSTLTTIKFNASPFNVSNGYNVVMTVIGGKNNEPSE